MHEKATFVFWTTLILYLITLFSVSYVGVYLTYIAIPLIVVSGLIMKLTAPKTNPSQPNEKSGAGEVLELTNEVFATVNHGLASFNSEMAKFNETLRLKNESTKALKAQYHELKRQKIRLEGEIKCHDTFNSPEMLKHFEECPSLKGPEYEKYSLDPATKQQKLNEIADIEQRMAQLKQQIETVKQACEALVEARHYDGK